MKNILIKTLFTIFLICGASLATFAQSNDNPPPKKEKQPVVPVKPKETPKPTPTPSKPSNTTMEISGDLRRITLIIS